MGGRVPQKIVDNAINKWLRSGYGVVANRFGTG